MIILEKMLYYKFIYGIIYTNIQQLGEIAMKTLIIIPAYNEEKNLNGLIDKIINSSDDYNVLIVNDCSTDSTKFLNFKDPVIKIDLPSNLGIGGAVQTGYKYAYYNNYDIAIQVDGDGQHDISYIKDLITEIEKGANLCVGSRFINKDGFQSTFIRRIGIKYFSTLISLICRKKITDPTSGFRACDRNVLELFVKRYPIDYPEPETLIYVNKNKLNIKEVPVIMNERGHGKSSITWIKSIYYMIKVSIAICFAAISN